MELRSICSLELLPTAEGCQGLVVKTVWHYVFVLVRGDLCRNRFARTTDLWDDLGAHQNVQAQNISAQASIGLRMLYCPCARQALQPMLQILPGHPLCLYVGQCFLWGKGSRTKPLEVKNEKFLLALTVCSVFWDIRFSGKPRGTDVLSCFIFAQHLTVRMTTSYLRHLGIRRHKWDY